MLQRNHKVTLAAEVNPNGSGIEGMSIDSDNEEKKRVRKKVIDTRECWTFTNEGKPIKYNRNPIKVGQNAQQMYVNPNILL